MAGRPGEPLGGDGGMSESCDCLSCIVAGPWPSVLRSFPVRRFRRHPAHPPMSHAGTPLVDHIAIAPATLPRGEATAREPMKIAFCFLTRADLLQPAVWESFFDRVARETYNVYCHPKEPAGIVRSTFRGRAG